MRFNICKVRLYQTLEKFRKTQNSSLGGWNLQIPVWVDRTSGHCQGVDYRLNSSFGQLVQESNQISTFYYFHVFLMYFS